VVRVKVMVVNATFNNISAISWLSVLLVEESGVTRSNEECGNIFDYKYDYEKKAKTVLVNKTNNHLSPSLAKHTQIQRHMMPSI
jgi:hypothetical protein